MAMTPQLWTISGLATELRMDRRTVATKLRAVPADGQVAGHAGWLMASAMNAIYCNGERIDLSAARAKLATAQEELVRLKVDRERGELLPADEVVAGWQAAIGRARALLLGIPPAMADTVVLEGRKNADPAVAARAVRELLVKAIDSALDELANAEFADDEAEPEAAA